MIPSQARIEVPLLEALIELGGTVKPKQVYAVVAAKLPELTPEDLEGQLTCGHIDPLPISVPVSVRESVLV
jgi:hypothetical protein